ncbi:hypothetical protein [Sphingobium yanoikuyae]|nr:hypothetical protein [Sphingobium yanoikuyae]WBQ18926.1 hypothetical protein PAE53_24005 [Sphingobium yanoikuyae]
MKQGGCRFNGSVEPFCVDPDLLLGSDRMADQPTQSIKMRAGDFR